MQNMQLQIPLRLILAGGLMMVGRFLRDDSVRPSCAHRHMDQLNGHRLDY